MYNMKILSRKVVMIRLVFGMPLGQMREKLESGVRNIHETVRDHHIGQLNIFYVSN